MAMLITEREQNLLDAHSLRLIDLYHRELQPALLNEVDELSKAGPLPAGVLGVAAHSLAALERYDEAASAAEKARTAEPGWAWLQHALAEAEAGRGRFEAAVEAQRQAARLQPGEPGYVAVLARYLRQAGQAEQAVRTARQALVLNADHALALNELGLALMAAGDPQAALAQFRHARAASPDDPAAYVNEGALHLQAGARGEARRVLLEVLKQRPGLAEAEDMLARTLSPSWLHKPVLHLLTLSRVTLVGWLIIAFLYYLAFRLLEFIWHAAPATMPFGRLLLIATLVWLLGGTVAGWLIRLAFRTGAGSRARR